jgi:ligand-binding sensor domain-containing protein
MSDSIWRVLAAGEGELLVATNDGAFLFDVRRESFVPLSERYPGAGPGSVSAAAVDAQGELWFGLQTSVEHVDRRSGVVLRLEGGAQDGGAVTGSFMDALHIDARGHVWVGTDRGLTCLDSAGHRLSTYGPVSRSRAHRDTAPPSACAGRRRRTRPKTSRAARPDEEGAPAGGGSGEDPSPDHS